MANVPPFIWPMKSFMYKVLAWLLRGIVRTIGRCVYRLRIRGVDNIPNKGGALLVANHASYMDFVLLVSSVPRYVSFVMNADVYHKPGLHWIMKGMNFIPIGAGSGKDNLEAFNQAVMAQINEGHLVVIFAEGTVTRTGQLLEFKKGVEHISSMISAPVIPLHFDNVQGTPFTFRGGRKKAEKFSFKTMRREVLVNIGMPIAGQVSAFMLRQKMKEMEVENFKLRISSMKTLDLRLLDELQGATVGAWYSSDSKLEFDTLKKRLGQLNNVMDETLQNENRVAILLPKGIQSYLINLWLLVNKKTSINIDPDFSNEERLYVCNKAKVSTLITTRDLHFTQYAPNADKIIYLEDMLQSIASGSKLNVVFKQMNSIGKHVSSWWSKPAKLDDVVSIFFQKKNREEMRCVSLTHRNLLAVLTSLRQVYHFQSGSLLLANIELSNVYGYVLEFLLPLISDLKLDIVDDQDNVDYYIKKLFTTEPSLVLASPKQLNAIAKESQIRNIPFLITVFTADVHPDQHAVQTLVQRGVQVMLCAGMMETSSVFAANIHNYQGQDIAGKILEQENFVQGTIGKPLPGVAIKACNENDPTKELSNDEVGVLWVKGSSIAPPKTDDIECNPTLVQGWYNTGWKGSVDHKGFVRVVPTKFAAQQ